MQTKPFTPVNKIDFQSTRRYDRKFEEALAFSKPTLDRTYLEIAEIWLAL